MALERLLLVAQLTGRGDAAFDRKADGFRAALVKYAKTRAPAHLDALPLLTGRKPRLYGVRVLTPEARAVVADTDGMSARALVAVRLGVTEIRHPDGVVEKAPVESSSTIGSMASTEWTKRLFDLGGGALLDELGAVVLTRADLGDFDEAEGADPLDLYALPSGARLAL